MAAQEAKLHCVNVLCVNVQVLALVPGWQKGFQKKPLYISQEPNVILNDCVP